jgi:predicted nucleotidyltransferase
VPSSITARVVFHDRAAVIEKLRVVARELAARRPEVEEVWLFGSLARGDSTARSDADLLVVLSEGKGRPRGRIPRYMPDDPPVPVDVFPFTREELEERVRDGDAFFRRALGEGFRLFP